MKKISNPPIRLLHQALRTNDNACRAIGTKLVSSLQYTSESKPGTTAGKGERDAAEHQHQEHDTEELPPLDGTSVGIYGHIRGRSMVPAATGSCDSAAQ